MTNERFVYIKKMTTFENLQAQGQINPTSIVFIEDSGVIWTNNYFFFDKKLDIIQKTITSDADGKLIIEDIEGYQFLSAVAFNNNFPLNVIRFGDYFYVGYYGGQSEPSVDTAVQLYFTCKANQEVFVYYIKTNS